MKVYIPWYTILHISDYDSQIMRLQELFPFKTSKNIPFHAKFNDNNVYLWIFYLL